jgi:hypothetical protein
MKIARCSLIPALLTGLILGFFKVSLPAENMMIVIIDGARYSETFGDSFHNNIPRMWNLSRQGTVVDKFYNDSLTYTARAIPALWCGTWTEVLDTNYAGSQTAYAVKPTIFEYFRKQKNLPAQECFYVLKYISSLWLASFDVEYGPAYWPQYHSVGSNDDDVTNQTRWVINTYHPRFLWVYLADVDGAGHTGDWQRYTSAIQKADSIVDVLWQTLQADPFYQNTTDLFVTNDHGRHDDVHGGFSGHGDGCEGCRHIQFLALGPDIKANYVSRQYRRIPDLAVTASSLLGLNPQRASGDIMTEIVAVNALSGENLLSLRFKLEGNFPNPFNMNTRIRYYLPVSDRVTVRIFDQLGQEVRLLVNSTQPAGEHTVSWNGCDNSDIPLSSGLYFYTVEVAHQSAAGKIILMK